MDVKFTSMEVSYLRQIKGYADLKAREASRANDSAQEAHGLLQEYLKLVARIHQVDESNLVLLPDWSGFQTPDPPRDAEKAKSGGT